MRGVREEWGKVYHRAACLPERAVPVRAAGPKSKKPAYMVIPGLPLLLVRSLRRFSEAFSSLTYWRP